MKQGQIVGWGSTVREIDHLAALFDEVVHIAPLHPEPDPGSSLPYRALNVRLSPVKPAGGNRWIDKLSILGQLPVYLRVMVKEMKSADIVHVRCPAAISLIALLLLIVKREPKFRWVKYAGNWQPTRKESLSYTIQRWIIKSHITNAIATVNGNWKDQPDFITPFFNPSMDKQELALANISAFTKKFEFPIQILFVGRLESAKGVRRIIDIARLLLEQNIQFQIHLIGDGPEKQEYLDYVNENHLSDLVQFHGWLERTQIDPYYKKSHFILLPSTASEGWPKVLSEAMAYGAIVLASNISSIPQILDQSGAGFAIDPVNPKAYADKIIEMTEKPILWIEKSRKAVEFSKFFTYDHYLARLRQTMNSHWGIRQ